LVIPFSLQAKKAVAWIVSGEKGCRVSVAAEPGDKWQDATFNMPLFPGDRVEKAVGIDGLELRFLPYAGKEKLTAQMIKISFKPPNNQKDLFEKFSEYVKIVTVQYKHLSGVSKDIGLDDGGFLTAHAALLQHRPIFSDPTVKGKTIIIKTLAGKEVFNKVVVNLADVTPHKLKLLRGQTYCLEIWDENEPEQRSLVRLLEKRDEDHLIEVFKTIDKQTGDPEQRVLMQAAYAQYLSDLYPERIDLYWLSYRLLAYAGVKKDVRLQNVLLGKSIDHFNHRLCGPALTQLGTDACVVTIRSARDFKQATYVSPAAMFQDGDKFSLQWTGNVDGYITVLYETADRAYLFFPAESLDYRMKAGALLKSCVYPFTGKAGKENILFVLSKHPITELETFKKLRNGNWNCFETTTPQQQELINALRKRVLADGQELQPLPIGRETLVMVKGGKLSGTAWFRIVLENRGR